MKKLLALLLSMLMVFSMATLLSSCGNSDDDDDTKSSSVSENGSGKKENKKSGKKSSASDEELIIGEWEMKVDYAEMLGDSQEELPFDVELDNTEVSFFWTFDEDGACALEIDKKSVEKVMEQYMDLILDQLTDDPDEKEAYKEQMQESMLDDEDFEPQEGDYEIKNNKLYIEGDTSKCVMTYKFDNDDTIIITDMEDAETDDDALAAFAKLLPLTLTRK